MQEELVTFQVAKLAKEKGFNISNSGYFYNKKGNKVMDIPFDKFVWGGKYPAPTQSLLQRWLREVHKIHIDIRWIDDEENLEWAFQLITSKIFGDYELGDYKTYEEALEEGLQEALKLIK